MEQQFGFYFDNKRCTGCKTCVLACKDYHDLSVGVSFRKVVDYEGGSWSRTAEGALEQTCFSYHVSLSCCHCSSPACTKFCPTGAMHKGERGLVSVDTTRCIGCGYCTLVCPYHAPHINPDIKKSSKCDGCASRLDEAQPPICVADCPVRALEFGPIAELRETHGDLAAIAPLPDASYTSPNICIRPSPAARPPMSPDGFVSNEAEIDQ